MEKCISIKKKMPGAGMGWDRYDSTQIGTVKDLASVI